MVKNIYSWRYVAERVEKVYKKIENNEICSTLGRIKLSLTLGSVAGIGNLCLMVLDMIILCFWEWLFPKSSIDIAEDFTFEPYYRSKKSFGNHNFKVDYRNIQKKSSHHHN